MANKNQKAVNSVSDITPITNFLNMEIRGGLTFQVDIKALMNADTYSEDAWINITPLLKAYNKEIGKWIRSENVKEYINFVNDEFLNSAKMHHLKSSEKEGDFNTDNLSVLKIRLTLMSLNVIVGIYFVFGHICFT